MIWTETKLWKAILARNNQAARLTIENCLPTIEKILRSAGTSPIDFTLHDDQHSFRVAERIFSLCEKQSASLSDNELSQLLLSAYLHDIGMSPSRAIVQSHYRYLCTADDSLVNPIERQSLQYWLDENWPGLTPPLTGINTASGISLAEEICAYYCRARHNDWSEDWIEENLKNVTPGLYPGWVDDLITLCKSHHEGYSELLQSKFDARLVGSPATALNLRYLAALLRVADVLEFDPERTPQVILHHRKISPASRVFWHRDQGIAFKFSDNRRELFFSARTPDANIHKGVLSVADLVNTELTCCHNLDQQGAFQRGVIASEDRDKYAWTIPSQLILDVKEKDDNFTYIDGTFRPDVTKLLQLLSGTQLYNNRFAAVRELVQNAADAIAEQIGYERLQQDDAENPDHERAFAGLHKIRLTFEKDDDRHWLRCADDGVGLNKRQIETRLLRSGSNDRPEFRALEREAAAKQFSVFRTGQFGIGLLSYFMIADRVEFDTKRSDVARDSGGLAWTFVTEGVASFGELTKSNRDRHGTEVRLRIRRDILDSDVDTWFSSLEGYLRSTVRHLPCKFELRNNLRSAAAQWSTGPGWTARPDDFSDALISQFDKREGSQSGRLTTFEEQQERQKTAAHWIEFREKAAERLRWFGPAELNTEMFKARYWVPYFELSAGASLCFIDVKDSNIIRSPDNSDAFLPDDRSIVSWKGFGTAGRLSPNRFGLVEIDVSSGADLAINRDQLSNLDMTRIIAELRELERSALHQFLAANIDSQYRAVNQRLVGLSPKYATALPADSHWKQHDQWKPLSYPFAIISSGSYEPDKQQWDVVKYQDETIPALPRVSIQRHSFADIAGEFGGARLAILPLSYGIIPVALWLDRPPTKTLLWTSRFPDG